MGLDVLRVRRHGGEPGARDEQQTQKKIKTYYHGRCNELDSRGVPVEPLQSNVVPQGWEVPTGAVPARLWAYWHGRVTRDEAVVPSAQLALTDRRQPLYLEWQVWEGAHGSVPLRGPTLQRAALALQAASPRTSVADCQDSWPPSPEEAAVDAAAATNTGFEFTPDARGCCSSCGIESSDKVENPLSEPMGTPEEQVFAAMAQPEAAEDPPPTRGRWHEAEARPTARGVVPKEPPEARRRSRGEKSPGGAVPSRRAPDAPSQPLESTMLAPTQAPAAAPTLEEQPLRTTGTGEAGPGGINGGTAASPTPEERASSSAPAGEAAAASPAPGPAIDLQAQVLQTPVPPLAPLATPSSTAVTPAALGEAAAALEPRENKAGC